MTYLHGFENLSSCSTLFSHPDYTVGLGISPSRPLEDQAVRGLYRRLGIAPCPEELFFLVKYYPLPSVLSRIYNNTYIYVLTYILFARDNEESTHKKTFTRNDSGK